MYIPGRPLSTFRASPKLRKYYLFRRVGRRMLWVYLTRFLCPVSCVWRRVHHVVFCIFSRVRLSSCHLSECSALSLARIVFCAPSCYYYSVFLYGTAVQCVVPRPESFLPCLLRGLRPRFPSSSPAAVRFVHNSLNSILLSCRDCEQCCWAVCGVCAVHRTPR